MLNATTRQAIKYVIVGGTTNAMVYISFILIRTMFPEVNASAELLACSLIAAPFAYLLNRIWVFQSDGDIAVERKKFATVYVTGAILGLLISKIFWVLLPFDIRITQGVAMVVIAVGGFVSQKLWTFKK